MLPLALFTFAAFVTQPEPASTPPLHAAPAEPALTDPVLPEVVLPEVVVRNTSRHWALTLPSGWTPEPQDTVDRLDAELERLSPGRDYRCVAVFVADAGRGPAGPNVQVHVVPGDYAGLSLDDIQAQLSRAADPASKRAEQSAAGLTADQVTETPPVLDRALRRITSAGEVRLPGRDPIRFRTTAMIGAAGLTKLIYYAPAPEFDASLPAYERITASFAFDDGHAYEPTATGFLNFSSVTRGAGSLVGVVLILVIIRSAFRKKHAPGMV